MSTNAAQPVHHLTSRTMRHMACESPRIQPRDLEYYVATVISFGAAAAGEPKVLCHKCELNIRIKCPFDAVRD